MQCWNSTWHFTFPYLFIPKSTVDAIQDSLLFVFVLFINLMYNIYYSLSAVLHLLWCCSIPSRFTLVLSCCFVSSRKVYINKGIFQNGSDININKSAPIAYITFIRRVRGLQRNSMPLGVQKLLIWTFIIQIHFVPALSLRLMNWLGGLCLLRPNLQMRAWQLQQTHGYSTLCR